MKTMKKHIIILFLVVALATLFVLIGKNKESVINKHTNRVGVIVPLTGPAGKMGEEVLRAIKTADTSRLELMVEDDQCSSKNALSAYEKLNAQGVDIFYIACSGSVLSVYERAKQNKDLIITAYAGSAEIRKTDDTVIRFIPDGLSISDAIVAYVRGGIKSLYVVYENQDYSNSVRQAIQNQLQSDIKVVTDAYKSDDTDFKSLALRIKSSGIKDILFVPTSDSTFRLLLAELKKNNIVGNAIGDVNVCDYSFSPSEYGLPTTCWKARLNEVDTKKYEDIYKTKWSIGSNYTFYNAVTTDVLGYLNGKSEEGIFSANEIKGDLIKSGYKGTYGTYMFTIDGEISNSRDYLYLVRR